MLEWCGLFSVRLVNRRCTGRRCEAPVREDGNDVRFTRWKVTFSLEREGDDDEQWAEGLSAVGALSIGRVRLRRGRKYAPLGSASPAHGREAEASRVDQPARASAGTESVPIPELISSPRSIVSLEQQSYRAFQHSTHQSRRQLSQHHGWDDSLGDCASEYPRGNQQLTKLAIRLD